MAAATPTQPQPKPETGRHRVDPRTPHANQAKNIPGASNGGTSHRK